MMRGLPRLAQAFNRLPKRWCSTESLSSPISNQSRPVATVTELLSLRSQGKVKKFHLGDEGRRWCERSKKWTSGTDAFVFLIEDGSAVAYVNRCPHVNLELDMEDSRMFTRDNKHLQCKVPSSDQSCPNSNINHLTLTLTLTQT